MKREMDDFCCNDQIGRRRVGSYMGLGIWKVLAIFCQEWDRMESDDLKSFWVYKYSICCMGEVVSYYWLQIIMYYKIQGNNFEYFLTVT